MPERLRLLRGGQLVDYVMDMTTVTPLLQQARANRRDLRLKQRRRWIRKPARPTRERYLKLQAAALDGTIDDAGAIELGRLSRRMPNAVKATIERRGLQLTIV